MQDSWKKNAWVWVGVVVVVIIVALFFVWKPTPAPAPIPPGTPVFAPKGQIVAGFPQNLIIDPSAQISGSYTINYTTSTNQYTAGWNSSSSLLVETAAYQQYLQANGWSVTPNPVRESTIRALSALKDGESVLVNIITQGKGSQVTVTYVMR